MKIARHQGGNIEIAMSLREVAGLRQCLNEVHNGYHIPDFKARIGVSESVVHELLTETRPNGRKRIAVADDRYQLDLTPADCRVIVACMKDTLTGNSYLLSAYRARIGLKPEEVKTMVSEIEAVLDRNTTPTAVESVPNPS
jgi:hypothetical protein